MLVGHTTVSQPPRIHSGVTAIVPRDLTSRRTLPAAIAVLNGYGKLIGSTQVDELGEIETPIVLTATLSAFRAADAVVTWMLARPGRETTRSINPLVAETNDGFVSDIRARPITEAHVLSALDSATAGPVAQGCVGAGTGTTALGYKAGIGTSSRVVTVGDSAATVGALVQANFSGTLTVLGRPIPTSAPGPAPTGGNVDSEAATEDDPHAEGNSCVLVVAVDAPLDARQLGRVARRSLLAMARVGSDFRGGSGDYAIAFSTAPPDARPGNDADLNDLFAGTIDATEEALLDSVVTATTTVGHHGTSRAVSHDAIRAAFGR